MYKNLTLICEVIFGLKIAESSALIFSKLFV